ncbi:Translation initiation factor IF-1, chloroplastic [Tetrabaena socialis]|uniref:Translation initiation factor IF-1, chloroplastic n=1 Tax=Tetrabaena socialis TaxID=47790 RepID=A0A2J8A9A0_9CHLO|nr:Translation initiation factor IF-1, chloroplastic [Tetrabaena socialis]|eukprot:PNH09112.1 Translation initiation factor IF-1, chloroplastic [Tetrabaena socialis]
MRSCQRVQPQGHATAAGPRCIVALSPVAVRPVRSLLHPMTQVSILHAQATVARAVANQAGTPPQKAGKKKVKKMVDISGDVLKDLSNGMFQVKLENGVSVIAHLSGRIRQNRIKVVIGDKVTVELSPYDLTKGRITLRHKPGQDPNANRDNNPGQPPK